VTLTVVDRLLMRFAVALIIAGGLLLIGSFVPVSPDFGPDQPALANAASTVKPGFGVKAPLAGLLDRAGPADKPYLSGFVLRVRWADIEPQPGRVDLSRIRAGLRFAATHGQRVVLRVTAGVDAPAWAQRLGGAPLPFFDHSQGRWLTLGRFWRPDYRREWGRLQAQLATAFDADPTLAQVNVCGTGEISCEVMLIFGADAHGRNGRTLIAAGYTPAARAAALKFDLANMLAVWHTTWIELTCHPWRDLDRAGRQTGADLVGTKRVAAAFLAAAGGRGLLLHTGLGPHLLRAPMTRAMYYWAAGHHYPFALQTETYARLEEHLLRWLAYGCRRSAMSIELPRGYLQAAPLGLARAARCTVRNAGREAPA